MLLRNVGAMFYSKNHSIMLDARTHETGVTECTLDDVFLHRRYQ